jgi:hypothetical protein
MPTPATLADGQLPSTKGTLYTSTGVVTIITNIVLANTSDTTARTVNLYLKRNGGTSRRLIGKATPLAGAAHIIFPGTSIGIRLSAGDAIEGDADAATSVDYLIDGSTQ